MGIGKSAKPEELGLALGLDGEVRSVEEEGSAGCVSEDTAEEDGGRVWLAEGVDPEAEGSVVDEVSEVLFRLAVDPEAEAEDD